MVDGWVVDGFMILKSTVIIDKAIYYPKNYI